MQSISVFLDKAKFADFRLKNADVSSQQNSRGVSRDSYIFWILLASCFEISDTLKHEN